MYIGSNNKKEIQLQLKLQELAKQMRKYPTSAEKRLWPHLKAKRMVGIKFRRQHPMFRFILDFYCHSNKLIIEIDGPIHKHQFSKDQIRDALFIEKGYTILRFSNVEVLKNIDNVIDTIQSTCYKTLS